MTHARPSRAFCIGWDVGGWNCDRNAKSRDAIVILGSGPALVGTPWRGNLRSLINQSSSANEFITRLFEQCGTQRGTATPPVILAIDAPLGLPQDLVSLASRANFTEPVEDSQTNHYLFRQTERVLFQKGLKPLSPIKDMIGSQATKAMHVIAKFAPTVERCGVWSDGVSLRLIEAYPATCRKSAIVDAIRARVDTRSCRHQDEHDALTCALVAYLFDEQIDQLAAPSATTPVSEGWIWAPQDAFKE